MENKCSICNEDLARYGNRKLKDGMLCRNCVKLCSEWLSDEDYLNRSVEDMKKHLEYRQLNLDSLDDFKPEKEVTGKYTIYFDEKASEFVVSKKKDFKKDNSDVFRYDDIKEISIFEEQYMDTGSVDLYFDIKLKDHDIDNVCFRINEFPGMEKDSTDYQNTLAKAYEYLDGFEKEKGLAFEKVEESDNG
jgi:hypothetical protein